MDMKEFEAHEENAMDTMKSGPLQATPLEFASGLVFFILAIAAPIHATLRPIFLVALLGIVIGYLIRIKQKRASLLSHLSSLKLAAIGAAFAAIALAGSSVVRSNGLGSFGLHATMLFNLEASQLSMEVRQAWNLRKNDQISVDNFERRFNAMNQSADAAYSRYKDLWVPLHWIWFDRCIRKQHELLTRFLAVFPRAEGDRTEANITAANQALAEISPYFDKFDGLHSYGATCRGAFQQAVSIDGFLDFK